jgi:hypothetical protein
MHRRFFGAAFALAAALAWARNADAQGTILEAGQTLTSRGFTWGWGWGARYHGAYDQYELWLGDGDRVEIFTSNAVAAPGSARVVGTIDTYLYLVNDTEGTQILAQDDDSAGNLQARIVYTATRTGRHWIRLRAYGQWSGATWEQRVERVGSCSLTYRRLAAAAPLLAAAPALLYDQPQSVTFWWNGANRVDGNHAMFYTNAFTGQVLTILTTSASSDTVLYLLDANGNVLDVDDDGGDGFHSRIVYRATSSGIVFIKVRPHEGLASGTCSVLLTRMKHPDLLVVRNSLTNLFTGPGALNLSSRVANIGDEHLRFNVTTWTTFFLGIPIDEGFNLRQELTRVGQSSFHVRDVFLDGNFITDIFGERFHWPGFLTYRLRNVGLHGAVGSLRATSQTNGWMIADSAAYDTSLPGAPIVAVRSHTRNSGGISIGWSAWNHGANSVVPIGSSSATPSGTYWLEVECDPGDAIWERDHAFQWNNVVRRLISIDRAAGTVTLLD